MTGAAKAAPGMGNHECCWQDMSEGMTESAAVARAIFIDSDLEEKMARVTGLEPATSGVTGRRSNQLSYTRLVFPPQREAFV